MPRDDAVSGKNESRAIRSCPLHHFLCCGFKRQSLALPFQVLHTRFVTGLWKEALQDSRSLPVIETQGCAQST
eukprot:187352-Amphidinium_carterae.2